MSKTRLRSFYSVYVAPVTVNTESTYTAGAPIKVANAIKGSFTDNYSSEDVYSDDGLEETINDYSTTDGTLEFNALSHAEQAAMLGYLSKAGYLVKSSEDEAPECAVGFAAKRANGTVDLTWYYCGKFIDSEGQSYETKADKTTTQTKSIKFKAYAREKADTVDGKNKHFVSINVNEEELVAADTNAKKALAAWFTAVQEPTGIPDSAHG